MTLKAVLVLRLGSKNWQFDVILEPSDLGLDGCELHGALRVYNKRRIDMYSRLRIQIISLRFMYLYGKGHFYCTCMYFT